MQAQWAREAKSRKRRAPPQTQEHATPALGVPSHAEPEPALQSELKPGPEPEPEPETEAETESEDSDQCLPAKVETLLQQLEAREGTFAGWEQAAPAQLGTGKGTDRVASPELERMTPPDPVPTPALQAATPVGGQGGPHLTAPEVELERVATVPSPPVMEEEQNFDDLMWEVVFTKQTKRQMYGLDKMMRHLVIAKMRQVAQGFRSKKSLSKPLTGEGVPPSLRLYETKFTKGMPSLSHRIHHPVSFSHCSCIADGSFGPRTGGRVIWEVGIDYSIRMEAYTDTIRIWAVEVPIRIWALRLFTSWSLQRALLCSYGNARSLSWL